jgi:hypothetical protein
MSETWLASSDSWNPDVQFIRCGFKRRACSDDPVDYSLQALREIPYANWRNFDPEDSVRFYAPQLRDAGMIKSGPNKILADGTDWRFWNELKRELKS